METSNLFSEYEKGLFPLKSIDNLITLIKSQVESRQNPNLSLISIILGSIENSLTTTTTASSIKNEEKIGETVTDDDDFPPLTRVMVEALYDKFYKHIHTAFDKNLLSVDKDDEAGRRLIIKKISDIIWNSLSTSYQKDKPHIQSLYSFLTGTKLDCFGVALATVAASQLLELEEYHLALSEDHAWVVFGEQREFNTEVTWHGKANEDKRGQPIAENKAWLYMNKNPVICNRKLELAAIVSGINPSINSNFDSLQLKTIQKRLLWILYDNNILYNYPMALANLADLEEQITTEGRKSADELFNESIESAKKYYNNQHVYPYTYYANYLERKLNWKKAIDYYAKASLVIKNYEYSKNDDEIYKEFLEITKKIAKITKKSVTEICVDSITRDPITYKNILIFFDGICVWESSSNVQVLHMEWGKYWTAIISKFDHSVRSKIRFCEFWEEGPQEEFCVLLYSKKMQAIKNLLYGEKLNSQNINLHITARIAESPEFSTTGGRSRISNKEVKEISALPNKKRKINP